MRVKNILILASAMSMALTGAAFAARSDAAQEAHRAPHKRHLAKHVDPSTASDADRDAGMYVAKPANDPEYFGHAAGSDGSMPQ